MQITQRLLYCTPLYRWLPVLALLVTLICSLGFPTVARADVIIGGCTIVSNPTAAHFTNCPNANLNSADLSGGMNLSFANLSGANLTAADVSDALLNDANLSDALLNDADVSGASLIRTNLSNANLTGTDISASNLSGANLTGVIWNNTICPDTTLSNNNGNTCVGHLSLPTITATATQADNSAYSAGVWTKQNVTVHFICAAAVGKTISSCPPDQTFTTDGSSTANGTATDNAGFFSTTSFGPVQIDKTAPTITANATKPDNTPYTAGTWTNQNVTVHFTCSDSGSGLAGACPADQIISAEGVTPPVNGAATDNAGNSANASFGPIQIDKTKPTISGNRTPPPNAKGWNSSTVTVSFTCTDNANGAGVATNTLAGATLNNDGANQTVTSSGVCTDNAANTADAATVSQINIDKSAPETTITKQPDNPSPLIATFEVSGTDALSGLDLFSCSLDGAPFTACTNPQQYNTLSEGEHTFRVQASDVAGNVDATPASYTWTASGDLPIAADQTVTTDEDHAIAITLQATGKNALTYTVVSGPLHGVLGGVAPSLVYTPTANFNGEESFTFRASDGQFNSNLATVTINVTPVDDPLVVNPTLVTIAEDTPISLTLNVLDVDGDALIYQVLRQPAHGALRGALPKVMYTPMANFNGKDSFTFSVSDSAVQLTGSALTGLITGTVHITITAVNDAPVAATQTVATTPGASVTLTLAATDAENDALTYSVVTGPQHGTITGTAPNLLYTPANNFTGDDQITFQVSDGQATSTVATILIRVTDKPFALLLPLVRR